MDTTADEKPNCFIGQLLMGLGVFLAVLMKPFLENDAKYTAVLLAAALTPFAMGCLIWGFQEWRGSKGFATVLLAIGLAVGTLSGYYITHREEVQKNREVYLANRERGKQNTSK